MKPISATAAGLLLAAISAVSFAAPAARSLPFRETVRAGNTLYISGVVDLDPVTRKPGKNAEESTRLALNAFKHAIESAGFTMDDLVAVQVFCTDLSYFDTFNRIYRTYFHGPMPTRAFVGVNHLLLGGHFEIKGIAVKGHE